jgi:U3 small nucleolar RNA-associated protein 25
LHLLFNSFTTFSALTMNDADITTTRLLTLLNVSATKAGKRKWTAVDDFPSEKLNKRKTARFMMDSEPDEIPAVAEVIIDTIMEPVDTGTPEVEAGDEGAVPEISLN